MRIIHAHVRELQTPFKVNNALKYDMDSLTTSDWYSPSSPALATAPMAANIFLPFCLPISDAIVEEEELEEDMTGVGGGGCW